MQLISQTAFPFVLYNMADNLHHHPYELDSDHWPGSRYSDRKLYGAAGGENNQGKESRGCLVIYAGCPYGRSGYLGGVWLYARRYAHNCYQFLFVAGQYNNDHPPPEIQPQATELNTPTMKNH